MTFHKKSYVEVQVNPGIEAPVEEKSLLCLPDFNVNFTLIIIVHLKGR